MIVESTTNDLSRYISKITGKSVETMISIFKSKAGQVMFSVLCLDRILDLNKSSKMELNWGIHEQCKVMVPQDLSADHVPDSILISDDDPIDENDNEQDPHIPDSELRHYFGPLKNFHTRNHKSSPRRPGHLRPKPINVEPASTTPPEGKDSIYRSGGAPLIPSCCLPGVGNPVGYTDLMDPTSGKTEIVAVYQALVAPEANISPVFNEMYPASPYIVCSPSPSIIQQSASFASEWFTQQALAYVSLWSSQNDVDCFTVPAPISCHPLPVDCHQNTTLKREQLKRKRRKFQRNSNQGIECKDPEFLDFISSL